MEVACCATNAFRRESMTHKILISRSKAKKANVGLVGRGATGRASMIAGHRDFPVRHHSAKKTPRVSAMQTAFGCRLGLVGHQAAAAKASTVVVLKLLRANTIDTVGRRLLVLAFDSVARLDRCCSVPQQKRHGQRG